MEKKICPRCEGDGKAHGADRPFEWSGPGTYPGPCPVCHGTCQIAVANDKERVADAIDRLDKLADLLADSLELRVGETPAVQTINEVLDILGEVGK